MPRYFLAFIIVIHGLIHFMGFAKAFGYGNITALTKEISKPLGALWCMAAVLFLIAAMQLLLQKDLWWITGGVAMLLSQILIFTSWQDARYGTIVNIILLAAIVIGYGTWHFSRQYREDVTAGLAQTAVQPDAMLTEADLVNLPEPVQKYIRYSGAVNQPKVKNFKVSFVGQIRGRKPADWMPFTSEQYNFPDAATRLFFMKATMKRLPLAGFHSFHNGHAFMDIRLLSLFKVQYMSGKEMGEAETVTFFNDMCCLAPATLIDKRIQWLETKGNIVKAAFTNNSITIFAWLYFNDRGELINFISDDRYAAGENHTMEKLRWSTPLKDYKELNGHKIAGYADAVYRYPDGDFIYGQFRTVQVEYNCIK